MANKELLEEFIRESLVDEDALIEEGIMDWLFSRWRSGSGWKGSGQGGRFESVIADLRQVYRAVDKIKEKYPRASKRIKDNIQRIMLDLQNVNTMIAKGVDEKGFLKGQMD